MKKIFIKILTAFLFVFMQGGFAFADFSFRDMELNFVQISDTHISDSEDTSYKVLSSSKALLEDAIKQVNGLKHVDFVMFTGDMVNEPLKKSYRDFFVLLTKLKYPSLTAFGNHDMVQLQNLDKDAPPYISKDEALSIIRKCNPFFIFDKSYYAFSPRREYRVIVLDTTIDDSITSNGKLTDEQAEFLKYELEGHKDKVILIFEHHPVVEPFKSEHHRIVNSETYMDIIKQYKKTPIAIFSGHYHAAKIRQQGNIIHVSTPSLVTYPNAFRYVNITNYDDRTIFNFKYMVTGLEDVHKKSKLNVIASAALRGLPSDQETIITIRKSKTKVTREDRQMQKEAKEAQKEALKQEKIKADELKKLEQAQNKALKDEEKAKALELKKKQRELRKLEKAQDKAFKEDLKKQEKINKEAQKANAGN